MSRDDINSGLRRKILASARYDKLMPKPVGSSTYLATGNTKVAIENMVKWAISHRIEASKIAQILKKKDVKETCLSVHNFLYNYIQYQLDGAEQQLHSPASAWAYRYQGVDCKSYSIFGSCILQNLNIAHFFRRIKQANISPDSFSHVYIVVPANGENMNDGYFVIDGTVPQVVELPYIECDDVPVLTPTGLGGVAISQKKTIDTENYKKLEKVLSIFKDKFPKNKQIERLHEHLEAIAKTGAHIEYSVIPGGIEINGKPYVFRESEGLGEAVTAIVAVVIMVVELLINLYMTYVYDPCKGAFYHTEYIQEDFNTKFLPRINELFADLDEALKYDNRVEIQHKFNNLFKEIHLGVAHYLHECSVHDGNVCSVQALTNPTLYKTVTGVKTAIDNAFAEYKQKNPHLIITEYNPLASVSERTIWFVVPNGRHVIDASYLQIRITTGKERPIKPVFPYEEDVTKWLSENTFYLKNMYSEKVASQYSAEVAPILEDIKKLREATYLYSGEKHAMEKRHQAELYRIYMKYDTRYKAELERDATIRKNANTLANAEFKKELEKLIAIEKQKKQERVENMRVITEAEKTDRLLKIGMIGAGTYMIAKMIK